ncbi:MAG: hypothetical protein GEU74_13935 [Nitriliruptorales bacterium]|nr:hypothetical protein [Nitriliruptorales bacterium]
MSLAARRRDCEEAVLPRGHAGRGRAGGTDGDGVRDGEEVRELAGGFDPLVFDDPMTPDEWASEFAKGAAIGNVFRGKLVVGGLSLVGVVPYVGDAANIAGKVIKFLGSNRHLADDAFAANREG